MGAGPATSSAYSRMLTERYRVLRAVRGRRAEQQEEPVVEVKSL